MLNLIKYETMFIFTPTLASTAVEKEVRLLKESIEKISGEKNTIVFEDFWGKRNFEYPIKKELSGYYVVLQYMFPSDKVNIFDEELRLDSKILRHLTIKVPKNEVKPLTYKEVMEDYQDFVDEKVAGKRKVNRISTRKESLDLNK
jgi:small subunit ribosomal protein S6